MRELTPERSKVAEGMVWCLDHAEAAEEIVECISESLSMVHTPLPKKVSPLLGSSLDLSFGCFICTMIH